jgi:hypothetical protein
MENFLDIFQKLHFDISFMDALVYMQKFASTFKNLISNKEKLHELAETPINAQYSAILLKKIPEKLGDSGKFLIPCSLIDQEVCNALADSGASINLMPLSIYEQLGMGALKLTRMTLELANRSISHPVGIAEDVFVRVNSCTFPADFVVVNFEADPRVPLILGRPFLRTAKALVDHFEDTLTLRHDDDIMIFKADASKLKKYSVKSVDVHDYSFDDFVKTFVSDSSPSFPPTKEFDSFWEEVDEFLAIETIPISETDESYFDSEGDIIFLDNLLNDEPSIPPDKVKTKIELIIDDPLEPELEEFLPDFESFTFDTTEEISGNPTYRHDFSDTTYEAFHFDTDHSEETSRGSTTSHALITLPEFESFRFDESECKMEKFSKPEYESFSFDLEVDHDPGGVLKNESFKEKFIPNQPTRKEF